MFNGLKNDSAFTLLEVVVVITIIGVLAVLTFGFAAHSSEIYRIASAEEKLHGEIVPGLERMVREFQTRTFLNSASGGTLDFENDSKSSCENCADKSTSIIYSWEEEKLYRIGNLSGRHVIADNVTDFNVLWSATDKILTILIAGTLNGYSISLTTSAHPDSKLQEVVF